MWVWWIALGAAAGYAARGLTGRKRLTEAEKEADWCRALLDRRHGPKGRLDDDWRDGEPTWSPRRKA